MNDFSAQDEVRSAIGRPDSEIKELTRRVFRHRGVQTQEVIFQWEGSHKKLVWCQPSFEEAVVNGKQNLLFHADYEGEFMGDEEIEARRRVQAEFEKHYGLEILTHRAKV